MPQRGAVAGRAGGVIGSGKRELQRAALEPSACALSVRRFFLQPPRGPGIDALRLRCHRISRSLRASAGRAP